MDIVVRTVRKDGMAEQTWLDKRLGVLRLWLIGGGLILLGLAIMVTLPGISTPANFVYEAIGISAQVQGIGILISGVLIMILRPQRHWYILCTLPWLLYTLSGAFFSWHTHLPATMPIAYSIIYGFMFLEGVSRA